MNRVLMLAEKLAAAPSLFTEGVEVASRLGAHGVSCSLTRQQLSKVSPGGVIVSASEGGSSPVAEPKLPGTQVGFNADQVIERASALAVANGLRCDTLKSSWTLPTLAELLAPRFALALISRVDGDGTDSVAGWWRDIIRRVQRPILMLGACPWSRIVIAGATIAQMVSLNAWAQHWARLWNLPISTIELRPLRWTAWNDWKTRCGETTIGRNVANDCMRYCGVQPTDLLLVPRRAACWTSGKAWHALRVPQLVPATYGSIGVLPTFYVPSVLAMLHGEGPPAELPMSLNEQVA